MQYPILLFQGLINVGIVDQEQPTVRRIRVVNFASMFSCVFCLFAAIFWASNDLELFGNITAFLVCMSTGYIIPILANGLGRYSLGYWLFVINATITITGNNWLAGTDAHGLGYFVVLSFIWALLIPKKSGIGVVLPIVIGTLFYLVSTENPEGNFSNLPETNQHIFLAVNVITTFFFAAFGGMYYRWLVETAEERLVTEQALSNRLIISIFPEIIAEKLKNNLSEPVAERFDDTTVLFADIVGFTNRTASMDAEELVNLLNIVFGLFDDLAQEHGVEKIKTIGDGYLAVCGLPTRRSDHAEAMARFALDLQKASFEISQTEWPDFQIRIAMHTGPVIAGVIGHTKFAYDVWVIQ